MENSTWTRKVVNVCHQETKQSLSVTHFHYTNWPAGGQPSSNTSLINFILNVHEFYMQQRSLLKPIIVHCSTGCGRTGVFCTLYAATVQLNKGNGLLNVNEFVTNLRSKRKYMVEKREHLKYIYCIILEYSKDILKKSGYFFTILF